MKVAVGLLAILLAASPVEADSFAYCDGYATPLQGAELPPNVRAIYDPFGGRLYPATAPFEEVRVEVTDRMRGDEWRNMTDEWLVLESLQPSTEYEWGNDGTYLAFRTAADPDLAPPTPPILDNVHAEDLDEGHAMHGRAIATTDDTVGFLLHFIDSEQRRATYAVAEVDELGNSQRCGLGIPLHLDPGETYRLEVVALDLAGNESEPAVVQRLDIVSGCGGCTSGSPASLAPALGLLLLIRRCTTEQIARRGVGRRRSPDRARSATSAAVHVRIPAEGADHRLAIQTSRSQAKIDLARRCIGMART